jgi:hypothetical protein
MLRCSGAEIEIDTPQGTQKAVAEGEGVYGLCRTLAGQTRHI